MLINMGLARFEAVSAAEGIELLEALVGKVTIFNAQELEVEGKRMQLHLRQRVPSPAELERQAVPDSIYLLANLTPGLRTFAQNNPLVALVGTKTKEVWLAGKSINGPDPKTKDKSISTRAPWARFGLLRSFTLFPRAQTQAELALRLGITQAAVSQNLATLKHLVEKTKSGWKAKEFDLVAKDFLDSYPGPGGIERYWFGIEPVAEQVSKVSAAYPEAAMSGDFAADQFAPWRMPDLAVFYSKSGLNLNQLGFIETAQERATLVEIVPTDRTVWTLAQPKDGRLLADPLLVAHDMKRSKGVDTAEAIEHLIQKLRKEWQ
jgi:hypothetical protein